MQLKRKTEDIKKDVDEHLNILKSDILRAITQNLDVNATFHISNNSIGSLKVSTEKVYKKNKKS